MENNATNGHAVTRLIHHWRSYDPLDSKVQVHQKDTANLHSSGVTAATLEAFLSSPREDSHLFHLALSPVPYVGDIESADIILLMLNPSLGPADYGTNCDPSFQNVLNKTRRQENLDRAYPCFALDPKYWNTSWFAYYEKLFRKTLWHHAIDKDITYGEALRHLSSRLAILELVPYYSADATQIRPALTKYLTSSQYAISAANEYAKKAEEGNATVIVRWGKDKWKLQDFTRVIHPESTYGFSNIQEAVLERLEKPKFNPISCEVTL